jgi:hypothetical protein
MRATHGGRGVNVPETWKLWAMAGLICATFGGVLLAKPWGPVIIWARLALCRSSRRTFHKETDRIEKLFECALNSPDYFGAAGDVARMSGHLMVTPISAAAFQAMHNRFRADHELPPATIATTSGVLDRDLINASFDEVEDAIHEQAKRPTRDVSTLGAWCITVGFILQFVSVLVA